ncbi:TrkH family potassium uptake protein [Rhodohalobacter mucosus]|uniref:Trk family potassium uptake protein n=1 Tax=Rhodohalobacter mucosus TaxID=2079485 RepID=A0A316TSA6_9BACT|nr:potassium transporter TrkG [Rhodohalobacter mucosus]PWN06521.1 Trk family potassium uptake protein [Rhodohalobacter mucosus]
MWPNLPYRWKWKLKRWTRHMGSIYEKVSFRFRFLQDDLYEFNRTASPWLHAFSILLSIMVFASLIFPLIFTDQREYIQITRITDQILLIAFGTYFYTRLLITPQKIQFLKSRWPEGIAGTLALFIGIELMVSDNTYLLYLLEQTGLTGAEQTLLILVQIYLVFLVAVKVIQAIPEILAKNINPARLVLLSFISVIIVGTLLLMLPSATVDGLGLNMIDALFMATSAVCVTGLIVVDTATHMSFFGQGVILVLIQLGGIGIITFATFLAMYLSGGIDLSDRNVLKETIPGEKVSTISKTMKRIVLLTFSIEFIGFIAYYFSWAEAIPDTGERIWFSLFHTVSAFCNAGFSLFTNSLSDPMNATFLPVNITTMVLIILGGIGFMTLWESVTRGKGKNRHKQFSIHSIIVFRMTAFLIITGTVLILIIEWNGLLAGETFGNKILYSAFQSITSRTAGFNTIDTAAIGAGATLIIIILMAIGASPSSTAGGLKTTTIYVLYRSMLANIIGTDRVEISNRTVPNAVILRAITSANLAFGVMVAGLVLLTIFEDFSFIDILFEQVSAFMTVGLSRGITGSLSDPGKLVIISSMFAGRVGMLTVAVAFAQKRPEPNYKYPEESVMVA